MCGRFHIDDETAWEMERIARKIDRKTAKTRDVHPSEPVLVLRADRHKIIVHTSDNPF